MGQFDLAGYTGNLDVHQNSPLSLTPSAPPSDAVYGLAGRPYITIHNGADPAMVGTSGLQTKNLPIEHWERIVTGLEKAGYLAAQLGEKNETSGSRRPRRPARPSDVRRGRVRDQDGQRPHRYGRGSCTCREGRFHAFGRRVRPHFSAVLRLSDECELPAAPLRRLLVDHKRLVRALRARAGSARNAWTARKTQRLVASAIELAQVSRVLTTIQGSKAYEKSSDAAIGEVNGFAEAPAGFVHAPRTAVASPGSLGERAKAMAGRGRPGSSGTRLSGDH